MRGNAAYNWSTLQRAFGELLPLDLCHNSLFPAWCHTVPMASCPKCDPFMEGLSFDKPRDYLELARKLLFLVDLGVFAAKECTCPLKDLFNPQWPADTVEHNFQCNTCGRCFQLFADTYHGNACWGLTGPQTKDPALAATTSS